MREGIAIKQYVELGEDFNIAYQTYASLYLDFVNDNLSSFYLQNADIAPLRECEEKDYVLAYIKASIEIAKDVMSSGYFNSFEDLYKEYPLLKKHSEELEHEFYENLYGFDKNKDTLDTIDSKPYILEESEMERE